MSFGFLGVLAVGGDKAKLAAGRVEPTFQRSPGGFQVLLIGKSLNYLTPAAVLI